MAASVYLPGAAPCLEGDKGERQRVGRVRGDAATRPQACLEALAVFHKAVVVTTRAALCEERGVTSAQVCLARPFQSRCERTFIGASKPGFWAAVPALRA